jgi:SAM-dependent methyltransferase
MSSPQELNRRHWDEVTGIHARNNVYGVDDFKAGGCRLHRVEREELGDVSGKTLLHLQCHFGLDTLSWARRGAVATGVDFSPEAIKLARSLAGEVGIDARFIESDVYALKDRLSERFDIVFTSYGVLSWLPNLEEWGRIIGRFLKPNGVFYIIDAHPFIHVFPIDIDITAGSKELRPRFPYFHDPAGTRWDINIDYADGATKTPPQHNWQHGMGDVVNALVGAGLRIEHLHEFPYCAWKVVAFAELVEAFSESHGYYGLPARFPQLPLMFSIKAAKPAA